MEVTYKAWIPTNNGNLSQFRVADSYPPETWKVVENILTLKQVDTFDYSDTIFKKNEKPLSYTLVINFSNNPWVYRLTITVNSKSIVTANGSIEKNGITKFTFETSLSTNIENLPNTIFTIVKNCVHGNNHHEQKVDRFIPIQEENDFEYSSIARQLANMIKSNEFESKRILRDNIQNSRRLSIVIELYEKAKGFKSYYDTFCHIFKKELKSENKNVGCPQNVLLSIESIKNQLEVKSSDSKFAITVFFSILAFFISSNILIKSQDNTFFDNYHLILFESIIVVSIAIAIFIDLRYIGIIRNATAPIVKAKEYYQRIFLYGEAVKKYNLKIPNDKKIYYYFGYNLLRYGHIVLGFVFVGLLMYGMNFAYGEQKNNKNSKDIIKNVETVSDRGLMQYIADINKSLFAIKTTVNNTKDKNFVSSLFIQNLTQEVKKFKNHHFENYLYDINKSVSHLEVEVAKYSSLESDKNKITQKNLIDKSDITDFLKKGFKNGGVYGFKSKIITQVDDLQNFLHSLGYEINKDEVNDAYFGDSTRIFVAKFQEKMGLKADGIVGKETRDKINAYWKE